MALPASATPAHAVRVADVVLIPAKASAFDVWAATDIVAAVKARKQSSKGIPRAAFVITMAKPRTLPGRQMDAALAELGLPVLEASTTVRVAYTYAGNQGTSVVEGPDRTARDETLAIRHELHRVTDSRLAAAGVTLFVAVAYSYRRDGAREPRPQSNDQVNPQSIP